MKFCEQLISHRSDSEGKLFNVFKERGSITGTNLFYVLKADSTKGEWFRSQRDAHLFVCRGWIRDTATGRVIEPKYIKEKTQDVVGVSQD